MTESEAQPDKWIAIDLDAVDQNLIQVQSRLQSTVQLIAVLKANAYGHGAVGIATRLARHGVNYFAVSHLDEALELRNSGIEGDILLFMPLGQPELIRAAAAAGLSLSLGCREDWQAVQAAGDVAEIPPLKLQLQVDTGLGRFGFLDDSELLSTAQEIVASQHQWTGIYTHMADAAGNAAYTRQQFARFQAALNYLERAGLPLPLRHCGNSAVLLNYPEMQLDAVRIGSLLSGQHPVGAFAHPLNLRDPFHFQCRIIALRRLTAGSYLGYYRSYRLRRDALIAVIPVGYRDGLLLEVANPPRGWLDLLKTMLRPLLYKMGWGRFQHQVLYQGQGFPLRGKVFMQMALIEFPLQAEVKLGDMVEVPVRKVLAPLELPRIYFSSDIRSALIAG